MSVQIEDSWKAYLHEEFEKPYFAQLTATVRQEYTQTTCYPPGKLIFNAFNLCAFDKVKVVIRAGWCSVSALVTKYLQGDT